jgi:ribulose-phosphate 3-epimerase
MTEFAASMMCANYACLKDEIAALEQGGIDAFHVDIMDGVFVNNFGMGIHDLRYIRSATKKSVECHLMIQEPVRYVELFAKIGVNVLYIHPESEYHTSTSLEKIIGFGITPAIAINPGTSVESILELLHIVKRVLVMGVNPGQAGQIYLPYVHKKICKLLALRDEYDFEVYWDGHGSYENVKKYTQIGVKGFVLGTAALFGHKKSYREILSGLKKC